MSTVRICGKCGLPTAGPCRRPGCKRPSAWKRGYDTAHLEARAQLGLTLPAHCAGGCGRVLTADSDWYAAHVVDGDPSSGWVAACGPCNEAMKRPR